jgi:probable F420-dependent oxidoreductase
MKLGLHTVNMGWCADPDHLAETARAAEAAGFDSIWTGEHVVIPAAPPSTTRQRPLDRFLDGAIALTWAAAATSTIRLGTGIVVLPLRNPVILAKELASLDVLSNGRLMFGIGVGNFAEEYEAVGMPWSERGAVADEALLALESLWYDERPEYHGRHFDFAGIDAHPRPVQDPLPVVVAGHSPAAYRRAVAHGTGWFGYNLDPDDLAVCLEGLRVAADRVERPSRLGRLEITVTPGRAHELPPPTREPLQRDVAARMVDLGVDRLIVMLPPDATSAQPTIEHTLTTAAGL